MFKQLSDKDIKSMIHGDFIPDETAIRRAIRSELKLSSRIPKSEEKQSNYAKLDLHQHTEEQAWNKIMELAKSGVSRATIITGASGILHKKFPQWATESILSPYIISATPINNGSFDVKFKRKKN